MSDVIGIGSAFIDYFFEVDKSFLDEFNLKPQDDLLFEDRNLTLKDLLNRFPVLYQSLGGMVGNTLAVLDHLGAKVEHAGISGKKPNICACLLSDHRRNRAFFSQMHPNDHDFLQNPDLESLKRARFIFIGPFLINPEDRCKDLENLLDQLPKARVCWSPSIIYARLGLKKLEKLLSKTEILFFNEEEVELLTGMNPQKGSRELLNYGPKVVVCTLGGEGALVTTFNQQFHTPAKKVTKVVDTTGAGDAFAAGFIKGLLDDKPLPECAQMAINISAQAITDYGLRWLKS